MNRLIAAAAAVVLLATLFPAVAGAMPYAFVDDGHLLTENGWDVIIMHLEPYLLEGTVVGVMCYDNTDLPYSPVDVAVAWGLLADPENGTLTCTMGDRQLSYGWASHNTSVDEYYVSTHVSNNHIIPRSLPVYDAVVGLLEGDVVVMRGFLVDVEGTRREGTTVYTLHWGPSSLVHDDEGPGACEIFLVNSIVVNGTDATDPAQEADNPPDNFPEAGTTPYSPAEATAGVVWAHVTVQAPAGPVGGVPPIGATYPAAVIRPQKLRVVAPALALVPVLLGVALKRSRRRGRGQ